MPRRRAPSSASMLATVVAVLLVAPSTRAADPEPVRFAWVRGPGADSCSSQPEIARQVTARLGRSPFSPDAARTIDAYVTHGDAGWRSEIYVREGEGQRAGARALTSDALDCSAVESATVLALALAIDPAGALRPPAAASPPPPTVSSSPSLDPVASSAEPRVAAAPSAGPAPGAIATPVRLGESPRLAVPVLPPGLGASGFAARVGIAFGLLPRPAAGVTLAAGAAVAPGLTITTQALWIPEVAAADPRFAFGLSALAAGVCARVAGAPSTDLAVCGAAWGGALHAVVRGLVPTDPGDRIWAALSATPRLRLRLAPRVHLELGTDLVVPLVRRPFAVTGWPAPVFQQSPVAGVLFIGLGANFP